MTALLEFMIPLRTKTGLNAREHWAVKAKRVKAERDATGRYWLANALQYRVRCDLRLLAKYAPGLLITLTRIGPRLCDDDNLAGGLKAVRDQVAEELGTDDGPNSMLRWKYHQERGPWGVRVRVERVTEEQ